MGLKWLFMGCKWLWGVLGIGVKKSAGDKVAERKWLLGKGLGVLR